MENLKILFSSVVGSHIYGLANEKSDYDFKGFGFVNDPFYMYGIKNFEQIEKMGQVPKNYKDIIEEKYNMSKNPEMFKDIVIYDVKKFVNLALSANPTILELLFVDEKWILIDSSEYRMLRNIRDSFISKQIKDSYIGYSYSQLHRMKNHKAHMDNPPLEPSREDFGLPKQPKIPYNQIKSISHSAKEFIVTEFREEIINEIKYYEALKTWQDYKQWRDNRNPERAELEKKFSMDLKHARHTMRLLFQGEELLKTGNLTVNVMETPNGEYLTDIMNGKVKYEDLIVMAEKKSKELKEFTPNSFLPDVPNKDKIEKILLKILKNNENI